MRRIKLRYKGQSTGFSRKDYFIFSSFLGKFASMLVRLCNVVFGGIFHSNNQYINQKFPLIKCRKIQFIIFSSWQVWNFYMFRLRGNIRTESC